MTDFKPGSEVWVKAKILSIGGDRKSAMVQFDEDPYFKGSANYTLVDIASLLDPADYDSPPGTLEALESTIDGPRSDGEL